MRRIALFTFCLLTSNLFSQCNTSGCLDTSFGTSGIVITSPQTSVSAVVVYPATAPVELAGKIVIAGQAARTGSPGRHAFLARYSATGVLDTGFGSNGFVIPILAQGDSSSSYDGITLDSGNNIVAVGSSGNGSYWYVARFTPLGVSDSGLQGTGNVFAACPKNNACGYNAVTVQGNSIIAAGSAHGVYVRRYTSSGLLDSSFGSNGTQIIPGWDSPVGVAIQTIDNDARVVVAVTCPRFLVQS